jgi:DNA-binding transcriptional regulator YiaG
MDIPALPFCKVSLKAQKAPAPAYPETLKTLGDHLRKRRLDLRLLQRQAAQKLGVDKASVHNWETTGPRRRFLSCQKNC